MKQTESKHSFAVLAIIGLIVSFFVLLSLFAYNNLLGKWSLSTKEADKLLKRRQYEKALVLLDNSEHKADSVAVFTEKGKVWMTLAWEHQNRTEWSTYGVNESDWLAVAEADSALYYLKKAAEASSTDIASRYHLAALYSDRGWYDDAHQTLLDILQIDSRHSPTRNMLGVLYVKMKRYPQGLREFSTAWELDNHNVSVAKNMASVYRIHFSMPDSAMVWMNRYLNLKPEKDPDASSIRKEMVEMLQRYPDFVLPEPSLWVDERAFSPRKPLFDFLTNR